MNNIFPITIRERDSTDEDTIVDMEDLKLFVEEFADILDDFVASTSDGRPLMLSTRMIDSNDIREFVIANGDK